MGRLKSTEKELNKIKERGKKEKRGRERRRSDE